MLDGRLRRWIDPPLGEVGRRLVALGVGADHVTIASFAIGLAGAGAIAAGLPTLGLALILLGRIGDGLDGAIARATAPSDRGGYLDIVLDFVLYAMVPLAFALADPANAQAAALLLASFLANGTAFLAYAVMAAKRGRETTAQGRKSLYYVAGIMEGTETILFFAAFCLWPGWFVPLATIMATLCLASAGARVVIACRELD